jgi:nitrate/TMAO reductase-like tetraheme cytochrome c subunit
VSLLLLTPLGARSAEEERDYCEKCHRDPAFLVTNKKLYDYYQQWSASVHKQEEVTCDDCHGGNPRASDKVEAHGDGVGEEDEDSGVYFKNVPETCGECHEEILEGFQKSNHFEHVAAKKAEDQGPTCVTCHGSIDVGVLNVNSVEAACVRCHNEETDNHPEHPEKAREILNRFLSISRFYRYITIRVEPDEAKVFFMDIDERLQKLSVTWHTFDLEKIDRDTERVLALLKEKRDEIRKRRAESAQSL